MEIALNVGWGSDRYELIDEPAARPETPRIEGPDSGYPLVEASGLDRDEIVASELHFGVGGVFGVQDERGRLPPSAAQLPTGDLYSVYENAIVFPVFVIVSAERQDKRLALGIGRKRERRTKPSVSRPDRPLVVAGSFTEAGSEAL